MNRQEIFNKVATHLLTQKRRAVDNHYCKYLSPNGDKCAIGAIIPDGHKAQSSQNPISSVFFELYPDLKEIWGVETHSDVTFLSGLQYIHDHHHCDDWHDSLSEFARSHNLNMVEVPS